MKKTISINISGIIFNIEEDGYNRLKNYLDEIKRYFSRYDDTGEISADIENRVAEIFSAKLSPAKQVITAEDVASLITQMGNVADFEAVEEAEDTAKSERSREYTYQQEAPEEEPGAPGRRLFRDGQRKIIGGVASGIAHYLRVDPFWIRLLFVIILFDLFLTFSFSSALLIGYIIIWVIVPERQDLQEDRKVKKMYRDPEGKIIGGVAAGISNYFGIDPTLIRVLFILAALLGGSGLLAYIIIWIITPEARTLTDRMQMQGEPLTLSNIEHNIKKNLNIREGEEENLFVKILLFPFRLLAAIFSGGSKSVNPLLNFIGDALRVLAGVFILFVGFVSLIALIAMLVAYAGINSEAQLQWFDLELPIDLVQNTVPWITVIAALLVGAIPSFLVILVGASMLTKRWLLPRFATLSLGAIWIISIVTAAITIPPIALNFRERDYIEQEMTFAPDSGQIVKLSLLRGNNFYPDEVDLTIKGTPDSIMRLEKRIYAHGRTSDEAMENAEKVIYPLEWKNNTLAFGRTIKLDKETPFRGQSLKATLYIPYEQKFTMDYRLRHILYYTLYPYDYSVSDLKGNTWLFNQNGELTCLECPPKHREYEDRAKEMEMNDLSLDDLRTMPEDAKRFGFEDFSAIEASGNLNLILRQTARYSVAVEGEEEDIDNLRFEQSGDKLKIGWKSNWNKFTHDPLVIYLNLPDLEKIELNGGAVGRAGHFKGNDLEIELNGASKLSLAADYGEIELDMSGAAEAGLSGRADRFNGDLNGASELKAYALTTHSCAFELSGASEAEISVRDRLEVEASGGSELRYQGNPSRQINRSGGASIRRTRD